MFKKLLKILINENGGTLAITRVVADTAATATAMAARDAEIEAVVNGGIDSDNIEDDGVTKAELHSNCIRANYGLVQHTDGALYADVSDTNPSLEISDGGLRAKVYGLINRTSNGLTFGRSGDILFSTSSTAPDGWTNVSATYADKFIRISATSLSSANMPVISHDHDLNSHTHSTPAHQHSLRVNSAASTRTGLETVDGYTETDLQISSSGSSTSGAASGDTASAGESCAYITLIMYQKD